MNSPQGNLLIIEASTCKKNNHDKNKDDHKNNVEKLNEESKNTQNKEVIQNDNNLNVNFKAPKRKTIYDDLNLRFKK